MNSGLQNPIFVAYPTNPIFKSVSMKNLYKSLFLTACFSVLSIGLIRAQESPAAKNDDPRSPQNATFSMVVSVADLKNQGDFESYRHHLLDISGLTVKGYCKSQGLVYVEIKRAPYIATLPTPKFPENWVSNPIEFPASEMQQYLLNDVNVYGGHLAYFSSYYPQPATSSCFENGTHKANHE